MKKKHDTLRIKRKKSLEAGEEKMREKNGKERERVSKQGRERKKEKERDRESE